MGKKKRSSSDKINLFRSFFQVLENVYGTYNPKTGEHRQVKKPVTDKVIYHHLKGDQPFGFYPLMGNITRIGVADFDDPIKENPVKYYRQAEHHEIPTYIEKSKSKG